MNSTVLPDAEGSVDVVEPSENNPAAPPEALKKDKKKDKKDKKKKHKKDRPYLPCKLASAVPISPDTKLFRFQVPADHAHLVRALPSPVAHIRLQVKLPPLPHDPTTTELLKGRPYTVLRQFPEPTGETMSAAEEKDHYLQVMIKRYDTFGVSAHLHSLNEGDTVQMQLIDHDKHEKVNFREIHLRHKRFGIVTAGTALAPMINIMRSLLLNAEANDTHITLLYANRHEEDILLRKELDDMWTAHPSRLSIYFLLSQPKSESWGPQSSPYQLRGRITKDMFAKILPLPSPASAEQEHRTNDPFVFVCGPKPFKKLTMQFLDELHFSPGMYYKL